MANWSFRKFYLASALVLALLPILSFFVLAGALVLQHIKVDTSASLGAIAGSAALDVERFVDEPRRAFVGLELFLSSHWGKAGPSATALNACLDSAVASSVDISDLAMLDGKGLIVAASAASRGRLGEDLSGQMAFAQAMAGAKVALSSPFVSPTDGTVMIAAVKRTDKGAIAAYLKLDELSALLLPLRLSSADRLALVDGSGFVVANTDPIFVREQRFLRPPGKGIVEVREGSRVWLATSREVPTLGWSVIYYRDEGEALALARRLGLYFGLVGAVSMALALILALYMRSSFSKPFNEIIARMRTMTGGRYGERIVGNYAEEFSRIADAFNAMSDQVRDHEERISHELEEKTVLLREVHHRVKNNLQIMSSLLELEAQSIRDSADLAIMKAGQNRVYSMSLVHELLYQTDDLSSIDMDLYARQLIDYLLSAHAQERLKVETELEPTRLPLERALPCGLILNEMLTNVLKYGIRDTPTPFMGVKLCLDENGRYLLEVKDSGPGLPLGAAPEKSSSLGFSLIENLAAQLGGSVEFLAYAPGEDWPGLIARLRFPGSSV